PRPLGPAIPAGCFLPCRAHLCKVRYTVACPEGCSSTNLTAGNSSNNDLSVNSTSENKASEGGRKSRNVSPDSDQNNVILHGLKAENIGVNSVNLTWEVNDTASSYTYRIEVANGTFVRNLTSDVPAVEIPDLIPGTLYSFTVIVEGNDTEIEGERLSITLFTKPSPVHDLKAQDIGVTTLNLTWATSDTASTNYTYRIEVVGGTSDKRNLTSSVTRVEVTGLTPGMKYQLTVFAAVNDSQTGEGVPIDVYTKPSPVHDLKAQDIGVTSVSLTWATNDTASTNYTYRIEVVGGTSYKRNLTSSVTRVEVTGLTPGMKYQFTVFAAVNDSQTEGEGVTTDVYTKPSPVHDLKAQDIGVTSLNLTWATNDTASNSYTYRIEVVGGTSDKRNLTSSVTRVEVTGLTPGMKYQLTVFAAVNDSQTGEGVPIDVYTKPSPVHDLKAQDIGVTSVSLTWATNDTASTNYTYRIEVVGGTSDKRNLTSSVTRVEVTGLTPGMKYQLTVFAAVNDSQTEGEGVPTDVYTKPSPVHDLKAQDIGVTSVSLTWATNDTASTNYTYRIEVVGGTSDKRNLTSSVTRVEVTGLTPGMKYQLTVFAAVNDSQTEGEGVTTDVSTEPARVNFFQCEPVAKQSSLMLKWECPPGKNIGFRIKVFKVFNVTWEKELDAPSCMEESSKETSTIEDLNYFSTYNVTIATRSDTSESPPVQITCNTSITDPPAPSKAPFVKAVSHSSLSVEFSDFESVNGPLKAYAVMITTEEQEGFESLKAKLNNTYKDFKEKLTVTYVTYVMDAEQAGTAFHSQDGANVVDVGNGNTMYGYENGPLMPLGSYRACVAGFTNITFTTARIIVGEDSYVSFTPCSEAVFLPQDPGVIAGALIGSLLAVLAVVAIGGFIFWRRKRKDKRNTEVSFSPIKVKKSKMIKVENFESYFRKQQADSNCGFAEEYEELKSAGVHQPKFAAELAENRGKNRYNNVLPYDISRVKLSDHNSPTDEYINASYIPGYNSKKAFIAAQGPLSNTIDDFWRMIWEKKIYSVVMLTKCVEQARTKCEQYWPDKQSKTYGDITVTIVSEIVLPEWTIRDFTVEKSNTADSHTVRQFHYTSWPDHGVPETTDLLINFRHLVHEHSSQNPIDSPILVHCSAGVGRTGTFIAIDRLIQQMEMENTVDVYGVVYELRMHRPLMVQTEDQYVFLNQCVVDIIRSQKEKKTDLIYQNMTAMAIYENFTPGTGFGKANGYHA
ncbi:receptor-type tyrosine-protein phosphatase eta, partial [Calypte anna]|uniref:receptor-type tyrosine-protein phosphatase eta n=1 Tax=Calypte anna TaxID=9244 RepID=UPI0011C3DB48